MTSFRMLYCWFSLALTSIILVQAQAAEMRVNISASGNYRSLDIEGIIESGDYERFLRVVKENQAQLASIRLYSPGGDFLEAIKIGRALRALELKEPLNNLPTRAQPAN
jgi:hypothetical protein